VKAAGAIFSLCLAAVPACAEEPWGWELPNFGKNLRIVSLYRTPAGDMVAWFSDLAGKGKRVSGFYDFTARKQLATPAEMIAIKDYKAEKSFLGSHHLTRIPYGSLMDPVYEGARFYLDDLSGGKCSFPYDEAVSIQPLKGEGGLYLVVWKSPVPASESYGCSYVDEPEQVRLHTRYRVQGWHFNWTTGQDKYLILSDVPWVVRFDAEGRTHFFDHRRNAGLVRAEAIAPLVEQMEGRSRREAQALVNKAETIIDAQLERAR
jgi:hypothetical protein